MSKGIYSLWRRTWWVVAFCLATGLVYSQFLNQKKAAVREMASRLDERERERALALQEKEDFLLRISSQSDPVWIEMILMRDLGVVPEGFLKVHFTR
jgi:hypothetical protein